MLSPEKIEEAIKLYDEGTKESKAKAYAVVRSMIKGIRTVKECEVQITQWKKQQVRADANLPDEMGEDEDLHAARLRDAFASAMRFDPSVIALIGLKRDAKHADFGKYPELPAQLVDDVYGILQRMERLMESNVNPTTVLLAAMQSIRNNLFNQDGTFATELNLSLTESVFSSDLEPKVRYDVSEALKTCNLLHDILAHM